MNSALTNCFGLAAFALLLSAGTSQQMAQAQSADASGITRTTMLVGDAEANVALSDPFELRTTLERYINRDATGAPCPALAGPPGPPTLGRLIAEIRACNVATAPQPQRLPGLKGLGGVLGLAFLDRAENTLAGGFLGNFNQGSRIIVSMYGQITDYAYDPSDGTGELKATTYITWRVVTSGSGNPAAKTEAYKWDISVKPTSGLSFTGFQDEANTGNINDPFPASGMTFSQDMLNRIQSLGFTRKLWVRGDDIVINQISHRKWNKATFEILDKTDPKYERLYDTTGDEDSCIDMFFAVPSGTALPTNMTQLNAQGGPPFYCLGRCANPMIINTGM